MESKREKAVHALEEMRGALDAVIAEIRSGEDDAAVDRLMGTYGETIGALSALFPSHTVAESDPTAPSTVVTVRTRYDYALNDPDALLAHATAVDGAEAADVSAAMYAILHAQAPVRRLTAPGLVARWGAVTVHVTDHPVSREVVEVSGPIDLLPVGDDERELRGTVELP